MRLARLLLGARLRARLGLGLLLCACAAPSLAQARAGALGPPGASRRASRMISQPITPKPTISAPPMMNSDVAAVSPSSDVAAVGGRRRRRLGRRQRAEGARLGARRSGEGEDEQSGDEGDATRHGRGQGSQAGAPVNAQREPANRPPHVTRRTAISATSPHQTPTMPQSLCSVSSTIGHVDGRCGQHSPHQEARVAGADQDAVEREHRAVERHHQREQRPDLLRLGDHRRVVGEQLAGRRRRARAGPAPNSAPIATDQPIIRIAAARAPSASRRAEHPPDHHLPGDRDRVEHEREEHPQLERDLVRAERRRADPREHRAADAGTSR